METELNHDIIETLSQIDNKYYKDNFDIIGHIVRVMGKEDFNKVKQNLEMLESTDEKLDTVIRKIIDKHYKEFTKMLGFVRSMHSKTEDSLEKLAKGRLLIEQINDLIQNVVTLEFDEYSKKSAFNGTISASLRQTLAMFDGLRETQDYLDNGRLIEAIHYLNSKKGQHVQFDKKFRKFSIVITVNSRFAALSKEIKEQLRSLFKLSVLSSTSIKAKNKEIFDFLERKAAKSSVPSAFTLLIEAMKDIYKRQEDEIESLSEVKAIIEESSVSVEKSTNPFKYFLHCLCLYEDKLEFVDDVTASLEEECQFLVEQILDKTERRDKSAEMIVSCYSAQIYNIIKKVLIIKEFFERYRYRTEQIDQLTSKLTDLLFFPLIVFSKGDSTKNGFSRSLVEKIQFSYFEEDLLKKEQNVMSVYCLFHRLIQQFDQDELDLTSYKTMLASKTEEYYTSVSKNMQVKSFFSISSFTKEFNADKENFNFLLEFQGKFETLKTLLRLSFGESQQNILKILFSLCSTLSKDNRQFTDSLLESCFYQETVENTARELMEENIMGELAPQLKHLKTRISKIELKSVFFSFIQSSAKKSKEESVPLHKNYRLFDKLLYYIELLGDILVKLEAFVLRVMDKNCSALKKKALLETMGMNSFIMNSELAVDLTGQMLLNLDLIYQFAREMSRLVVLVKVELFSPMVELKRQLIKANWNISRKPDRQLPCISVFLGDIKNILDKLEKNLLFNQLEFAKRDLVLCLNLLFVHLIAEKVGALSWTGIESMKSSFEAIMAEINEESSETPFEGVIQLKEECVEADLGERLSQLKYLGRDTVEGLLRTPFAQFSLEEEQIKKVLAAL